MNDFLTRTPMYFGLFEKKESEHAITYKWSYFEEHTSKPGHSAKSLYEHFKEGFYFIRFVDSIGYAEYEYRNTEREHEFYLSSLHMEREEAFTALTECVDIPSYGGQRSIVTGKYEDFRHSYLDGSYFERYSRLYDERWWSECAMSYSCEKRTDENGNDYSVDIVKEAILRVPYNDRSDFFISIFNWCISLEEFTEYEESKKPELAGRIFDLCFLLREQHVLNVRCRVSMFKIVITAIAIVEKLITPAMIREPEKFAWFKSTIPEKTIAYWCQVHAWNFEMQSTGTNEIEEFVKSLIAANPKLLDAVKDIKAGNAKAMNSFKGPVIKQFKGKIDISQLDTELTNIFNNIH